MSPNWYWLIDAKYREGTIQLSYLTSKGQIIQRVDQYKPYFLVETKQSAADIQRRDLFLGKDRYLIKVPRNTEKNYPQRWEYKIDPAMSYIYDNQLRFGTLYQSTGENLNPDKWRKNEVYQDFCKQFNTIKGVDPVKYAYLEAFFNNIMQPIPELPLEHPLIRGQYDEMEIYRGLMLSRIGNLPLNKALTSRRVSEWIKSMLYSVYRQQGILIPNNDELTKGEKVHAVEGALTLTPQEGVYFGMHVMDFESLYPSCIDYYNLSYETVDIENKCQQTVPVPTTQHQICMDNRGIFSALIGALKELRINWFKPLSKNQSLPTKEQQQAKEMSFLLKIFMNSCYGVTIRIPGLACPPLAESITAYGRWALQQTDEFAREKGMNPVYGDTDSLFIADPSDDMIDWLAKKTKAELGLDLALDVKYSLCVLTTAKKAYFGIFPDGRPDLKGVTLGKSSTPLLFRKIFLEVTRCLKDVNNVLQLEKVRPQIVSLLRQRIKDIQNGKFTINELEYRVKLWKTKSKLDGSSALSQPYQARIQLEEKGITIQRRQEIGFVKVKPFRFGKRKFTVKPTQNVKAQEIDIPDYIRKLEMAFEQVLVPLKISFPKGDTLSLEGFF